MNTGPDGSVYLGNAPFRRIIARVIFGNLTAPIIGGTTKYGALRQDLIVRDATCAAEARAQNTFDYRMACPESSAADVVQLTNLISQARDVAPQAIEDGDLSAGDWAKIDKELKKAEKKLATGQLQHLQPAANAFRRACAVLD